MSTVSPQEKLRVGEVPFLISISESLLDSW